MPVNNVYTRATVVKDNENVSEYVLGSFNGNSPVDVNAPTPKQQASIETIVNQNVGQDSVDLSPLLQEFQKLQGQIASIQGQVSNIEANGVQSKDIDQQVIRAIQDLKHYATFFEQATFQLETKVLKTSISIAQKIINIEVSSNSAQIAKETITLMLNKIKNASKVSIHLNPKDFVVLRHDLQLESFIEIQEDPNVTPGGVVIASDLGNFDGNIEAKVNSMLESLDTVL